MTLQARAIAALLVILAAVAGWWRLTAFYEGRGYARAQAEAREEIAAQQERNRELQRAAEIRYTVQAQARDRFITKTIKEVRHAAPHLDSVRLGERAVSLLNDALSCAASDRPAACESDGGVPPAAAPALGSDGR